MTQVAGKMELMFEKLFLPEGQHRTWVQVYSTSMSNGIKRGFQVQLNGVRGSTVGDLKRLTLFLCCGMHIARCCRGWKK